MARLFSQRHYIAIAAVIEDQGFAGNKMDARGVAEFKASARTMDGLVDRVVNMFKADSSKFDEDKFRRACGYETS